MDSQLDTLIQQCRTNLSEAGENPQHPWRLFTAANVDQDGFPQNRYVVLRKVNSTEIMFFTDQRSAKVNDLKINPMMSLCFFNPDSGLQLAITAKATLHNQDAIAEAFWANTPEHSRKCYQMNNDPGSIIPAPFVLNPDELTEEDAYKAFTVVKCQSVFWDILLLKKEGNQRACCNIGANDSIQNASWVIP
jgi:pyridoxamine 5'-phosphate oxidase